MGAQAVALLNGGAGGSQMQQPQQGLAGRMSAMGSLRHAFNGGPNQSGPGEGSPSHLVSLIGYAGEGGTQVFYSLLP